MGTSDGRSIAVPDSALKEARARLGAIRELKDDPYGRIVEYDALMRRLQEEDEYDNQRAPGQ
jgi:hypothetical protein